jgi:hypothetical protein
VECWEFLASVARPQGISFHPKPGSCERVHFTLLQGYQVLVNFCLKPKSWARIKPLHTQDLPAFEPHSSNPAHPVSSHTHLAFIMPHALACMCLPADLLFIVLTTKPTHACRLSPHFTFFPDKGKFFPSSSVPYCSYLSINLRSLLDNGLHMGSGVSHLSMSTLAVPRGCLTHQMDARCLELN